MNKLLIVLLLISSVSCGKKAPDQSADATNVDSEIFDWLLGSWKRNNDKQGNVTYETWIKQSDNEYRGLGFTLQGADTISKEQIKLLKQNNRWSLNVKVASETSWTTFMMTSSSKSEFVCENPENEFPNKIKYWSKDKTLNALVSSEGFEIPFEFDRID